MEVEVHGVRLVSRCTRRCVSLFCDMSCWFLPVKLRVNLIVSSTKSNEHIYRLDRLCASTSSSSLHEMSCPFAMTHVPDTGHPCARALAMPFAQQNTIDRIGIVSSACRSPGNRKWQRKRTRREVRDDMIPVSNHRVVLLHSIFFSSYIIERERERRAVKVSFQFRLLDHGNSRQS